MTIPPENGPFRYRLIFDSELVDLRLLTNIATSIGDTLKRFPEIASIYCNAQRIQRSVLHDPESANDPYSPLVISIMTSPRKDCELDACKDAVRSVANQYAKSIEDIFPRALLRTSDLPVVEHWTSDPTSKLSTIRDR